VRYFSIVTFLNKTRPVEQGYNANSPATLGETPMMPSALPQKRLRVLVVGQGGREHALVLKLAESARVETIYCAPGNAGTAGIAQNVPVALMDFDALANFAIETGIDLTIVGPADPVAAGIVDHFRERGLTTFGPTRAQAILEGSKVFSKAFMQRHNIPTARYASFTDAQEAMDYLAAEWQPHGMVVKVDGLADVQSTLVTDDITEARAEIARALVEGAYGEAGERVIIEERLMGPEVSLLAFVDGKTWRLLPPAQDHKQLLDGGLGPNTEGMGAYAPAPLADERLMAVLARDVMDATCHGLAEEGIGYQGVLFVGVLLTANGPKVLEYNCRFGDPETQVALPGLVTDLVDVIEACLTGNLDALPLRFNDQAYVCVVAADPVYPARFVDGALVSGLDAARAVPGVELLHAMTRDSAEGPLVNGGRVINVVAGNADLGRAREAAYSAIAHIRLAGAKAHYRTDIASQALAEFAGATRTPGALHSAAASLKD
jgi:phosphoribosylamine--glycine ligase